jgi:hypothetical protein
MGAARTAIHTASSRRFIMPSQSLMHDVAWATAAHVVELFAHLLREEEQREVFAEVYERIRLGLEFFETRSERMLRRLAPGKN